MLFARSVRIATKLASNRRATRCGRFCPPASSIWLEGRVLLAGSLQNPIPLATAGNLAPGGADFYQVQAASDGRMLALAHAQSGSLELRLALLDGQGNLLVESDGQSIGRVDPLIDQHIAQGTTVLEVQSLSGSGAYSLFTSIMTTSNPHQTLALDPSFQEGIFAPLAVGDFNNDKIPDIVASDGIHLGTGDGTFEPAPAGGALVDPTQSLYPSAMAVGYFNGDTNLDLAVALAGSDSILIELGDGFGNFHPGPTIQLPAGSQPYALVAGDFGNGRTDLAVADAGTSDVTLLMSNGNGTFQDLGPILLPGVGPVAITEGFFEHNGLMDLAVADFLSGDVTILSNQGAGNFVPLTPIQFPSGSTPLSLVAGDFGTGSTDLAVVDSTLSVVDILDGNGNGQFSFGPSLPVGTNPFSIVAGDFGNGQVDLATANATTNDVSVLLGKGDGTFQPAISTPVGTSPIDLVTGYFNNDNRLDLATGNAGTNDISVLLGNGDGTFEGSVANHVGYTTAAAATGDFTGNGNLGVAVINQGSDTITILPGNGDGTFQQPLTQKLPAGSSATAIVAADFNGDGRLDLAVALPTLDIEPPGELPGAVAIFLGNGDGTFQSLPPIPVPGAPEAIALGDFTGNGRLDLAVADNSSSDVTILLNNGDGTFQPLAPIPLLYPNSFPSAIVAGDFTGDDHVDLAVAEVGTDQVAVLLGNGDGTFQTPQTIWTGDGATSLAMVAADFRNDGRTDLAVATTDQFGQDSVQVLMGNGQGGFEPLAPISFGPGVDPVSIVAADFNGDGLLDLATADSDGSGMDDYSVYVQNSDGTFQGPSPFALDGIGTSTAIVTGDFAGNGRTDLAITRKSPDDVQVRLSNGDGTFSDPSVIDLVRRETPLIADMNGDGAPDVFVVDAAGDILYRAGRPGQPGSFASPVTVNPGDPSRDVAFVVTSQGRLLASVDSDDNAVSLFALQSTGFVLVGKLATGNEPAQILAADLDGNGVSDLIIRNAGDGTISVFLGDGAGGFRPRIDVDAALGASDLQVADLRQTGRLDIVFTNRISGEVGVLENFGGGLFSSPLLYRAGQGPYGVTGAADPSPVSSFEGTTSVTVGTFTPGGFPSLVALNPGSNTFGLLSGFGDGRLANPTIFPTPGNPLVIRAINFGGSGGSGLAILTADGLYIEKSDGQGGFLPPTEIKVGFEPNGLTVADLSGDGIADLLVSNPLGDVLTLIGNGDGTFQPVQNLDRQVSLAVYTQGGSAPAAFIFADQRTNQLIIQSVNGGTTVLGNASSGLISPGAVTLADLDNNGILDLIVANSGSNNVLVYPGLGNGTFGSPLNGGYGFFTGTNPVGITVADVNNDGRPDLVIANKGSNDVSILINEKVGSSFTFVPGPRLKVGDGPVSTQVATVAGNSLPDLIVANSGSNDVWLLQGIGNGFFNDQNPIIYPVGTNPSALFVGNFMGGTGQDLVTINSGSNDVTLISGVGTASPFMESISSGGIDPTAAFAVDIHGDGQDSLVVANNADGNIALLLGGENGLSLSSIIASPGLPNPSALAFASFDSEGMNFYATTDGVESATLLGFQLEESAALASETSASAASAQLVSLNESSLALIGTLLTFTIESPSESEQTAEASAAQVASAGPGAAGQSVAWTIRNPEEDDELGGDAAPADATSLPAAPFWARFVSGVDQAIEKVRSEADERLRQERQPAKPESPGTSLLDKEDGNPKSDKSTFIESTAPAAGGQSDVQRERLFAVDVAIALWEKAGRSLSRSLPLLHPPTAVRERLAPAASFHESENQAPLFPVLHDERAGALESGIARMAALVALIGCQAELGRVAVRPRSSRPATAGRWNRRANHLFAASDRARFRAGGIDRLGQARRLFR
jgi:large repetitive protein